MTVRRHVRTLTVGAAIGMLVLGIAAPAVVLAQPASPQPVTVQQVALTDAQSVTADATIDMAPLMRGTYSATTEVELASIRAARAEAARKAQLAQAAALKVSQRSTHPGPMNRSLIAAGTGEVRYPLPPGSYSVSRTLSASHNGADMAASAKTPIFAMSSGIVRVSSEGYAGYGVAIVVDHTVGGKQVSTLYGHMTHGTRIPNTGDTVTAGQLIGLVGNTGRSRGSHLHFEVRVNGALVEPISWLRANAH